MKAAVLGTLVAIVAVPAMAADLLSEPQPILAPALSDVGDSAGYNWSGAYGGVLGGMSALRGSFVTSGSPHSTTMNERFAGAFVGYQYQFSNNIVLGAEADARYNFDKTRYDRFGVGSEMWTDWSGTIRARVGYAFDRTLIYATGGFAAQRGWVDSTVTGKDSDINTGYVVGAGLEYAFTDSIFGRFEYQFTDYRKKRSSSLTTSNLNSQTMMVAIGTKF
ncbi:MAG: porin family protein [Proteobacteria bacterium]|nr:porin family protein [Pseudomonadota bacterium]